MRLSLLVFLLIFNFIGFSQEGNPLETDIVINEHIEGSLLLPVGGQSDYLAIIIAGSGPTDRNGNQNFLKSNNLKKLAQSLAQENIASFRYDKRIVKQIRKGNVDKNIMFDDFVTDASSVINYFSEKNQFKSIYVIGHSQGSLVGMMSISDEVSGFISLAGAGQSIDVVITEQIQKMAPGLTEDAKKTFEILKKGETTTDYPPALASVFNIDTQPFISNWMQYQPKEIISKVDIPILIVNGTKDLQVSVEEANQLKEANPKAQLVIIENMNHVLFIIEGDDLENSKSYNESFRPISTDLVEAISSFIKH
ncbi:alpha/beta hydrolase [Hanstruepera neustonica]|uniref:Alpha/beta hydrolase n=1 Tax=Hanstruepera neustonica TaxID=1445657 RepID=A0A2K1E078_9FLAO|nr:alpha/beta hydrolase [Hanstruepera neustonica]PNQ73675.1 alpha/beta hydrolase [Hanstruepera neustonica]